MSALPPVSGLGATSPTAPASHLSGSKTAEQTQNAFEGLLSQVNSDQKQSEKAIEELITGKNDNVHQVVMQVVKSEMSFQLFVEVRNQLMESYNELMRMQF